MNERWGDQVAYNQPSSHPGIEQRVIMGRIGTANRYFRLLAPLFEFLGITALVILALVYPDRVQVDWPIVALIVLLLLVPFLPFISRVRYGEIEAELDTPSREEEMADLGESPQITGEGEPLEREETT